MFSDFLSFDIGVLSGIPNIDVGMLSGIPGLNVGLLSRILGLDKVLHFMAGGSDVLN
jgi:hypothetical protein